MDTEKYKSKLAQELAEVTSELKDLGIQNPEVPEDWLATPPVTGKDEADPNTVADRVEDWEERRATLSVLETRYNNIRRALKKIEENTYGICEIAGEQIETDRLEANPSARTCKEHLEEESQLPQ